MIERFKDYVVFFSPGTFVAEQTRKPIEGWDTRIAVQMAAEIVERYDATPYGFSFTTVRTLDPIPDSEGGYFRVEEKVVKESGTYYIDGEVLTESDIRRRAEEFGGLKKLDTLLFNVRHMKHVVTGVATYRWWKPWQPGDAIVDKKGNVVRRCEEESGS